MFFAYSRVFSCEIRLLTPRSTAFRQGIRAVLNMTEESKPFVVEYASQGRAKCKTCKQQIEKKSARIGKLVTNPFSEDGGLMKQWYHVNCIFETLSRARASTRKIESTGDLDGFEDMNDDDKKTIEGFISESKSKLSSSSKSPAKKKVQASLNFSPTKGNAVRKLTTEAGSSRSNDVDEPSTSTKHGASKDDSFREFRHLCTMLAGEPSYNAKTKLIADFLDTGASQEGYNGDVFLLAKLLLPGVNKRVYNLQSKQLIKLFSQILRCDQDEMLTDLEKGDVAETISDFFEQSIVCKPVKKSTLTNQEVDEFLDKLATLSKEDDQLQELRKITRKCTVSDLKYIIRLIKHDLRMNIGAKHVLEAIDPDAYKAFQASNNLNDVIKRCLEKKSVDVPSMKKKLSIRASLMTPIKPMLAEACKSFPQAIKKSPGGMYAEIKYDGERVQVHKSGHKFEFFSRNLKPVTPHKVAAIKDFLPKACPHGNSLILDSEVLLVDNKTGNPLPFGTLGIHKKSAFKDASVCLFIFDCIHFNDENLMQRTMQERRQILEKNVTTIPNRIMLSETTFVKTEKELSKLMARAMREGLEGLVLKDLKGIYEPGKRHWLKMKKDYLEEGAMADTADLVVLGAYYGTGNKGGLMSIFLMGVYNPHTKMWCTVAKCGNGHDDKTIERLNRELKVKKISKDPNRVPFWLEIDRSIIPDFVVDDPKKAPVWEITGAEFSKSTKHTANGISIRFPRVTRIRDDKDWKTATDLDHLVTLFKNSRAFTDTSKIMDDNEESDEEKATTSKDVNMDDDDDDEGEEDEDDDDKARIGNETKSRSIGKRKADVNCEENGSEAKKKICKYGSKCYQTNPEHLRKYFHSVAKTPNEYDDQPDNSSKSLPSVFSGLQIFLEDDMKDVKKLKRYIIAYDGDVVPETNKETATHIVADRKELSGGRAVVVSANWVWACIKNEKLVPVKKYQL